MARRKYILPRSRKDWTGLASDLLFVGLTIFLLFTIRQNYEKPMDAVMQFNGKPLPAFRFYNFASSREESLEDHQDKVVLLNIWATWCPPCRKEMPELDQLQKQFGHHGLTVLALSDEDPGEIAKYVSTKKFSFQTGYFISSNKLISSIQTRPVSILLVNGKVKDIVVGARGLSFFSDWAGRYVVK